jgi:hypothetical protein
MAMKYLIFVCVLVLAVVGVQPCERNQLFGANRTFAAGPEDHGDKIVSNYDGFSHETVVTLKKMKVSCAGPRVDSKGSCVSILASLHCPGIQLDYVRQVTLQVVFETEDWDQRHPLDQRELSVVADGETFRLGRMRLVGQSVDTLMTETLEINLPYKTFQKMALGEVVELQVGKSKFELRNKNLMALRDLNNRVKFAKGV